MSELTNIHARAVKDLTTPTELPVDPDTLNQVKLVAGNFPAEYAGNEAMTVGMIKDLAAQGRENELEEVYQRITQEETRAKEAELFLTQSKADKTYVDAQDLTLQTQINQKAETAYLNNALAEQTQTFNTSLSQLSTAANKFYPTLAEANTNITNIAVNQPVTIGEVANGGLWYKATTGATSLTKSPYDPLTQAKADATAKAEAAKNNAITAAATDATTKANTAEAKAKQAAENNDVRLLQSIQKLAEVISDFYLEFSTLSQSNSNLQQTTDAQSIRFNTSIQKLTNAISLFRADYDASTNDLTLKSADNFNLIQKLYVGLQATQSIFASNKAETDALILANTTSLSNNSTIIQKLHVGLQATQGILGQVIENITVETEDEKLQKLMMVHGLVLGLSQLDGFNPKSSTNGGGGSSAAVQSNGVILFKTPSTVLRINIEADAPLPTAKGTVINTKVSMNVEGSSFDGYGTLEVQGSSSVAFPKKNWTLAFFTDEAREETVKIKLGHMMPHDELVFKANFVDNTHCRNIGVNRIWDQMQMSRIGYPKREPDFVNMINNNLTVENYNGLKYQPTGALGHVDGFPCVMYINGDFYGIGSLNIGKKRDNYNLKKDDQKHIQFEPGGGINLNNMPVDPTDGSFDLRRPATWGSAAQASYDRLSAFFKLSVADMTTAGIDNYLNRAQMIDYIILLQVCDLFDHLHKNTLFTTWDGKVWNLLPYDVDNCFGLYFTGQYFNPSTGVAYRSSFNLPIPPLGQVPDSSWGVASRLRAVYGTDVDKRYKYLRDSGIISNDNFMKVFEDITRFFPQQLLEAENTKWNTGATNLNESLLQTGSLYQINQWLTERLVRTDIYFNYSV